MYIMIYRFIKDIEGLFRILSSERADYPISEARVREIQSSILCGAFHFAPAKLVCMHKDDPLKNHFSTLAELPGLPSHLFTIYFEPDDELVILALGGNLYVRLNEVAIFHSNSFAYRMDRNEQDFHKHILSWNDVLDTGGKVESALVFDFSSSIYSLSRTSLLEKIESVFPEERFFLRLVSSFLHTPLIGVNLTTTLSLLPSTFFSSVLFNFFLDNLDRAFDCQFPLHSYARYDSTVVIPILSGKNTSKASFLSKFTDLVKDLGLTMTVVESEKDGLFFIPGGIIFTSKERGTIHIVKSGTLEDE